VVSTQSTTRYQVLIFFFFFFFVHKYVFFIASLKMQTLNMTTSFFMSTSVSSWHVAELTAVAIVTDADVAVVGIAINAVWTLAESPGIMSRTVTPIMTIFVMSAAVVTLEIRAELSAEAVVTSARVVAVHVAFHAVRALTESSDVMGRTVTPVVTVLVMSAAIVTLEIRAELSAEAVVTGTRIVRVHGSFYTIRPLAESPDVLSGTVAPIVAILIRSAAIVTLEIRAELASVSVVTSACVIGVHGPFYTIRTLAESSRVVGRTIAPIVAILIRSAAIVTLEVGAELASITIVTGARVVAVHVSFDTVWALTESPDVMGRTVAPIMPILIMSAAIVTLEVCAELAAVAVVTGTRVIAVHVSFYTIRVLAIEARIMGRAVAVFAVLNRCSSIVTHCKS
jgi:hypothetical protein